MDGSQVTLCRLRWGQRVLHGRWAKVGACQPALGDMGRPQLLTMYPSCMPSLPGVLVIFLATAAKGLLPNYLCVFRAWFWGEKTRQAVPGCRLPFR